MKIATPKATEPFQPNGFYEHLLALRGTDRKAFDSLSPVTHLALGEYERQKLAASKPLPS